MGTAAHYLFGLPWSVSLILGAVVSSTDASAVFSVLRERGLTSRATLSRSSSSSRGLMIQWRSSWYSV